jgi:hypothetical protein
VRLGFGFRGLVTIVVTLFFLTSLAGYQVTGATAGPRLLGRLGAALIELDRWLPAHLEDIRSSGQARASGAFRPNDLPIEVTLAAGEAVNAEAATLQRRLVQGIGDSLYRNGELAFHDQEGNPGHLAVNEPARWTLALLDQDAHSVWRLLLPASLVLLGLAIAAQVMQGHNPLPALAAAGIIGSAIALANGLLGEVLSRAAVSPIDREIALILRDGAWLTLRDCVALALAAGVLSFALGFLTPRPVRRLEREARPGPFS